MQEQFATVWVGMDLTAWFGDPAQRYCRTLLPYFMDGDDLADFRSGRGLACQPRHLLLGIAYNIGPMETSAENTAEQEAMRQVFRLLAAGLHITPAQALLDAATAIGEAHGAAARDRVHANARLLGVEAALVRQQLAEAMEPRLT